MDLYTSAIQGSGESKNMSALPTILLVGDYITDRTWVVGEPSLIERYNSHYAVHPHTLVDPARETDVAGGITTVARAIASVMPAKVIVVGAWSYYVTNELARKQLIPPEGLLKHDQSIDFRRVYEPEFTSVKTRVYLPEPGGARLSYRFDRNSSVATQIDKKRYDPAMVWPDPDEVSLVILGDYGYGVLNLPKVQEQLKRYADPRRPIIMRSSSKKLIETLPWDVLLLNPHHCANLLDREPFDTPVTKHADNECTYHPSLVRALDEMANGTLKFGDEERVLLLNLEKEGALLMHNGMINPFMLAAPHNIAVTGVGANDVLLAHFGMGMINDKRPIGERLADSCERGVRASAAFVSRALQLEKIPHWTGPRIEVSPDDINSATPILQRPAVPLTQLSKEVNDAQAPLSQNRIRLRDAGWYLDSFHTVDERFGDEIVRLKTRIKEYVHSGTPKRPFLAVLCGDPGAGKSTLAEALGKYSECEFIYANAAQWTSADDLFELCERIRNARMLGRRPLAFIDEVDSPTHNQDLYAKLLAPVWDGTYSVHGQTRALGTPTVFILAGSSEEWRSRDDLFKAAEEKKEKKLEDLVSRLTIRPLEIPPLNERSGDIAYLVANHIVKKFPRVNTAAYGIFELMSKAKCRYGARSIATIIDKFGPLQQERFVSTSDLRAWTDGDLSFHLSEPPKDWKKHEGRVEITL